MSQKIDYEVPSWGRIYNMLLRLAERIKRDCFRPDVIVGVSRGGWPPARILSDLLENPNLANVRVEFYVGVAETNKEPKLTQPVSVDVKGKMVLVVDEVADTGKSLRLIKEHLLEKGAVGVRIATIFYKPWSIIVPDYYAAETSRWIVFPWEIKETVRKIVRKCRESGKPVEEEMEKVVNAGLPQRLVNRFLKEILEEELKC
ncbi:MAG: phosphoribosyltransferase [Candidatus Bathyarchaeota archaeon]|nr:phosphoribosyltransferase [Candidatus Bathyarchaeota archaeon]